MEDKNEFSLDEIIAAEDDIPGGFRIGCEGGYIYEEIELENKYAWAKNAIESDDSFKYAYKALDCFKEVKDKYPYIFAGDNIYVWEDLARLFDTMDDLNNAVYCFKSMTELDKECSDPYLNLGTLLHSRGYITDAIKAYKEGLAVNPNDEYIYYNLSSLLMEEGLFEPAVKMINAAILENPDRAINYMLKGEIYFNRHKYYQAIASYEWAIQLMDESYTDINKGCIENLIQAYENVGNSKSAKQLRKKFSHV